MRPRNGEIRSAPRGPSLTGVPLFSPLRVIELTTIVIIALSHFRSTIIQTHLISALVAIVYATGMTSGFSAQAGMGAAAEMRGSEHE